MKAARMEDLPKVYGCRLCDTEKPIAQMIVVRVRKTGEFRLRPRCKKCNNERERGHRREYKRNYLRRWRARNADLHESYWRQRNSGQREHINALAHKRFLAKHDAILIQGRLRRQAGMKVTIQEAEGLLRKYGRCFPFRKGLTPTGLRECERIRSSMRRLGKIVSPIEIRMMVYEDGHHIKPSRQVTPYRIAAQHLRQWQQEQRAAKGRG